MRALGLLALVLAAPAAAQTAPPQAGIYQIEQMEMGGGIALDPKGTFQYGLDYGAVSESARGKWAVEDGAVVLTSDPMPKPPRFILEKDDAAPVGELYVALRDMANWPTPLDVIVAWPGGDPELVQAGSDGRVDLRGRGMPASATLAMPIYDAKYEPQPLKPGTGHRLMFRFEPNDMGQAAFNREKLAIDGEDLILHRYGVKIRLNRMTPDHVD